MAQANAASSFTRLDIEHMAIEIFRPDRVNQASVVEATTTRPMPAMQTFEFDVLRVDPTGHLDESWSFVGRQPLAGRIQDLLLDRLGGKPRLDHNFAGDDLAAVLHGHRQGQRLAAGARAEVDDHLAAARRGKQAVFHGTKTRPTTMLF